jgi:hypothetical protein
MRKEHVTPVMAENPYTGKLMNVEPLFRFLNMFTGSDEIDDVLKHITINAHHEETVFLLDQFSGPGGMYLCLYELRDMFKELDECKISAKKGKSL